jgi:hypothetical protein
MPAACTFDSLTVNVNSLILAEVVPNPGDTITVTLMAQPPTTGPIPGPSVTLSQLFLLQTTGTATGSMAVPAGSYVWLQISGSALADFPAAPPSQYQSVIDVASHCN